MNQTLSFGTDGIRGHAQQFPFTDDALFTLGLAIGTWAVQKYSTQPHVLIAHDTRLSCGPIKKMLIAALTEAGVQCVDASVLPTPAVLQLIVGSKKYQFGLVISASHNPYYDNGIKIFDANAGKLSTLDEQTIEKLFTQLQRKNSTVAPLVLPDEPPSIKPLGGLASTATPQLHALYMHNLQAHFPQKFLAGQTVVLDCAHGATYQIAPKVFRALGANVIALGSQPNGTNINDKCGAMYPQNLRAAVAAHHALVGFAFDGDGDRVVALTRQGEIKDGDDLLALLMDHPACKKSTSIVGTVMTNHGFATHTKARGLKLIRTQVGDKHIAAELQKQQQVLGGETSGHIIMTDYLPTGDGIFVALRCAQTMLATGNRNLSTFTKFPQQMVNVPVAHKGDLQKQPYRDIISTHELKVPAGRVVVRYSGTENYLRVMVEDSQKSTAERTAHSLAAQLQNELAKENKTS